LPPSLGGGQADSSSIQIAEANMQARLEQGGRLAKGSVTVIGDSVCLGAASVVADKTGGYVDAAGYRTMRDAIPIVSDLQSSGSLGEYVVIALMTNRFADCITATQELVNMLEPGHRLIFVTSYGVDDGFFGLGEYVRSLPLTHPYISIAPWDSYIQGRDDLLTADGIHCGTPQSREIYAQAIQDAIDASREGARS
jgi:hypothetical protein